ncbi:cytochrome c biogenesis heme-transporting ATPase CcmA [Aquabacterium humicola]|uniref:cytochrome c biogenesis heme-transporting ATPase CcmA n=1 Tax=Aquabacterium humicola TaxID=3237377 RepID=UPI002543C7BD|nr:cytochrome c biogenesis heme-transporting ATPase CcmA [Rubrivivax pictus]
MSSEHHRLPTLSAQALACRRGERWLFHGLALTLPAGRALWLRGRNGRGKTSLLRLAAGLAEPAAGTLQWGDEPLARSARFRRERVWIGHGNALKDDLSAAEALRFVARLHGRRFDAPRIAAALEGAGVATHAVRPVRTLSQGQRRRVALARLALEDAPGLWLLDEPFDALDADALRWLARLAAAHVARGGSLMFASHQPPPQGMPAVDVLDLDEVRP